MSPKNAAKILKASSEVLRDIRNERHPLHYDPQLDDVLRRYLTVLADELDYLSRIHNDGNRGPVPDLPPMSVLNEYRQVTGEMALTLDEYTHAAAQNTTAQTAIKNRHYLQIAHMQRAIHDLAHEATNPQCHICQQIENWSQ